MDGVRFVSAATVAIRPPVRVDAAAVTSGGEGGGDDDITSLKEEVARLAGLLKMHHIVDPLDNVRHLRLTSPHLSHLVPLRLVSSRLVSSRLVSSRLVSSRLVSSRLVSSRLVSARLGSSRLVSPRLVSSRLVSSRLVSSRLVSPRRRRGAVCSAVCHIPIAVQSRQRVGTSVVVVVVDNAPLGVLFQLPRRHAVSHLRPMPLCAHVRGCALAHRRHSPSRSARTHLSSRNTRRSASFSSTTTTRPRPATSNSRAHITTTCKLPARRDSARCLRRIRSLSSAPSAS